MKRFIRARIYQENHEASAFHVDQSVIYQPGQDATKAHEPIERQGQPEERA